VSTEASKRKICVVVGSRANYGSIKTAMRAVQAHRELELQVVVGASALLDRYGEVARIVEADGFEPAARVHMLIEGETTTTMAKSTGLGLLELPTIFDLLKPDLVITVGDRFETMATAVAAAYMNIALAHTMGGEVTGTIDESVRHAVTKLAHVHFPANEAARERIIRMGEDPAKVFAVGCPRIDVVAEIAASNGGRIPDEDEVLREGVGADIDLDEPFLLVAQYPVTTEYGDGERQIGETLEALRSLSMQTIALWPNADAGSEDVARGMRKFRERHGDTRVRFYKNFPVETYVRLMARSACVVGNTSSAIREGAYLGAPSVNVGSRQEGRDRGANVIDVPYDRDAIEEAVQRQVAHGRYVSDHLYGDGRAGERIAEVLAGLAELDVQKRLMY
jgi:UDP-hydrolysing UDP-N-acetyl-D-glucosamine 2-epimerase